MFIILCVLCFTNAGFVQCLSLDSFQVCRSCYIQGCFSMLALPHNYRVCAMLFAQLPLVCTPCYIR